MIFAIAARALSSAAVIASERLRMPLTEPTP